MAKVLTIQKTQKNISLHYDSGKCLRCKLCIKMCKMNSLHMVGIENSIANLLDTDNAIFTSDILYCTRCKSSFIGSGEYCATCFNREQLF